MHRCLQRAGEATGSLGVGVIGVNEPPDEVLGAELCPLKKQKVFLTTEPFSDLPKCFDL